MTERLGLLLDLAHPVDDHWGRLTSFLRLTQHQSRILGDDLKLAAGKPCRLVVLDEENVLLAPESAVGDIHIDGILEPHEVRDPELLLSMVNTLEEGGKLPPVIVEPDGTALCGSHRIAAYRIMQWRRRSGCAEDGYEDWDGMMGERAVVLTFEQASQLQAWMVGSRAEGSNRVPSWGDCHGYCIEQGWVPEEPQSTQ